MKWFVKDVSTYNFKKLQYPQLPHDPECDETMVTMQEEGTQSHESEIFNRPIEELEFWKSTIGESIDMDGIETGRDDDMTPIWDTDEIKRRLKAKQFPYTKESWEGIHNEEEEPDFESEENLEAVGIPSSVIQDEEDS